MCHEWIGADSILCHKTHVRGGHFLEQDIAAFDAPFFGIPTQTAIVSGHTELAPAVRRHQTNDQQALDPQLRIQLEVVYEALEDGESG